MDELIYYILLKTKQNLFSISALTAFANVLPLSASINGSPEGNNGSID